MKISYNWLQDYFEEKLPSPERIAEEFTLHSFEVESFDVLQSGDTVFDLKILPDRAHDAMSHYGIARELGVLFNLRPKDLKIETRTTEALSSHQLIKVAVEDQSRCRRAMKRVAGNIVVSESPEWLKERLASIGQRSINNVVDVANFVMFELGQPVHTFDFDKIDGDIKHISVRSASQGEKLTALDGKTYTLDETMLVIADQKQALDIAGIKGGESSGVDSTTKSIMLSVCNFEPTMIRKTRTKLGLKTDASDRFERGLSSKLPKLALLRLSYLLQQVAGGEISSDFVDVYPEPEQMRHIAVSLAYINKLLGMELSEEGLEGIFRKLQLSTEKLGHSLYRVDIPSNRLDLMYPCDIAEEIIRVEGYDALPIALPQLSASQQIVNPTYYKMLWAREQLLSQGYSEVFTYAFREKGEFEVLASTSNKKCLRANLTDGLKESIALNERNAPLLELDTVKLFEIGTVFTKEGEVINVAYADKKKCIEVSLDEYCKECVVPESYGALLEVAETTNAKDVQQFKMWSPYPFIVRDVALWVPEKTNPETIIAIIRANVSDLLVAGPRLFDTFTKEGRTSYAFRLVFQSYERTLTDDEVNTIMIKITTELKQQGGWEIR